MTPLQGFNIKGLMRVKEKAKFGSVYYFKATSNSVIFRKSKPDAPDSKSTEVPESQNRDIQLLHPADDAGAIRHHYQWIILEGEGIGTRVVPHPGPVGAFSKDADKWTLCEPVFDTSSGMSHAR
jgi:hypothetical protein